MVAKDMATTPGEFHRLLPRLAQGMACVAEEGRVIIGEAGKSVVITTSVLEPRRIAGLVLERCRVELTFDGMDGGEIASFLARFDRVYHKGGG